LNDLHMWKLFHSILHIGDILKESRRLDGGPFKPGFWLEWKKQNPLRKGGLG
jgi:hypothetical protein